MVKAEKIVNARIADVAERNGIVAIELKSLCGSISYECTLSYIHGKRALETIMRYTNSKSLKDLKDKVIRIVVVQCSTLWAIGDPIVDEFFEAYGKDFIEFEAFNEEEIIARAKMKK